MDHESLRTAATYLNNLLLARGHLRNGEPIDFVKPSKDSRAQIINLVHDLILRQDRDREQREHVAVTLRTLRAEESRRHADLERLSTKCEEAARSAAGAQAAERAAVAETKKIERATKTLQEQSTKLKTQLAQVKTQCINDLKKRDLELSRLKSHLQGQQRGHKGAVTAPSMTIVGAPKRAIRPGPDVTDPEYTLKQETTEFLTELSQSLSDENDGLISLIRDSLGTMQDLLGLSVSHRQSDSGIGSMASIDDGKPVHGDLLHSLPTSYEAFSAELERTLAHLKTVLTNPNFVTMEEVEVRDEEIARLREGWEKMEQRWKDVLLMMQGWLRRMDTGDTINVDELRRGMGLVSPVRGIQARDTISNLDQDDLESSMLSSHEEDPSPAKLPSFENESPREQEKPLLVQRGPSSKRKRDQLEPPEFFDLRPRAVAFSPDVKRLGPDVEFDADGLDESSEEGLLADTERMTVVEKLALAQAEADEAKSTASSGRDLQRSSKQSLGESSARSEKSPQAICNLEGTAAETRHLTEKERADGSGEGDDTLGSMMKNFSPMAKRTKIRGRPRKKRKSTLSPEELAALIGVVDDNEQM